MHHIHDTHDHDLIVVGAGIAGLAAALTAAGSRRRVLVLDAHAAGGRARTLERDGYLLNVGPHGLYRGAAFERLLERHNVAFTAGAPEVHQTVLVREGIAHPQSLTTLALARTPLLSGRERVQLATFFGRLRISDPRRLVGTTVSSWLADLSAGVREFVEMLVRISTYTDAPERFDAGAAAAQLQLATGRGVRYVDGGWSALVEGMRARLVELGVEVRTGTAVASVTVSPDSPDSPDRPDGPTVISVDGTEYRAAAVVIAAGGPDVAARLTGTVAAGIPGVAGLTAPVTASVLDLGLGRARPLAAYALDEPLYLSAHAPAARLAPEGAGLVTVMRYHSPGRPAGDPDTVAAELRTHAWRSGVDPADVVVDRFLHRLVVAHGAPTAAGGGLAGRPPVDALAALGRPDVFLAGDWVGADGLLADAAVASGTAAARRAIERTRARIPA